MNQNLRLPANTFLNLVEAFKANGWEIPDENAGMESRFKRFCERLSILDTTEQSLVIELTKHFTVISGIEYLQLIIKLLDQIHSQGAGLFPSTNKFFVLPLVAPQDFNKTKSSNFVWYYFKDELVKYNPVFQGKSLVFCDVTKASWVNNLKTNEAVILLDDYIGSGETAISAINWLIDNFGVNPNQIVILSIAAQDVGMQYIAQQTSVTVYAYHRFSRGISDYYSGEKLTTYLSTMNRIEEKLKVDSDFNFGYNNSEALISLIRTPNNTFPVFWTTSKKNKHAPFPRD